MLVILVLGSLYSVTGQLEFASRKFAREDATSRALLQAKEALLGYAATYRDTHTSPPNYPVFGYLPCPDTTGSGSADATMSDTACGVSGKAVIGLLPFKELGLPELRDSTGECLWYAVSGSFKASATKPTPMNWDTQGQFEILDASGNSLVTPNDANGGVAAVIFSVGSPLGARIVAGQNLAAQNGRGTDQTTPCGRTGQGFADYVDFPYSFPSSVNPLTIRSGPMPDETYSDTKPDSGINDRILWITPKEIFDRVKKRSDLAGQINTLLTEIKNNLSISSLPASATSYTVGSIDYSVGQLPDLTVADSSADYLSNFSDQIRYARCNNTTTYCLSINSQSCDGTLLFGGADISGNPRITSARAISNYFETPGALALASGSATSFTTNVVAYDGASTTSRATDVGLCLSPYGGDTSVSFASNIDSFTTKTSATSIVTPDVNQVTLGLVGGAGLANLYGCFWYPTPTPFLGGLRAYFYFNIAHKGEGFTFAIADANPSRNASTNMCGGTGAALGYSDIAAGVTPINMPKLALEFDNSRSAGRDPAFPTPPNANHAAFDYWGTVASATDDNVHGAGSGTGFEPTNPLDTTAVPSGIANQTMNTGTDYHVRLDIDRNYNAGTTSGTYTLTAYVYSSFGACDLVSFQDLSANLSSINASCTRKIAATITVSDPADGFGEAMKNIYFGFTNAQSATRDQSIAIHNFQIKNHL